MATITVSDLNRNISGALRLADREDLVVVRSGEPCYRITRIADSDPVDRAIAAGWAQRDSAQPQPLVATRVPGISSREALDDARDRR